MQAELWRRIAFTLGALVVTLIGTHIPLPGLDRAVLNAAIPSPMSIFALSLTPYLGAAMLLQVLSLAWRRLRAWQDDGEHGREVLERRTRIIAIVIAALQSLGIATALTTIDGAIAEPPALFIVTTIATLVAGTLFLVWLAGQITARGIGNGIALILLIGVARNLTGDADLLHNLVLAGNVTSNTMPALALLTAAMTIVVVAVERARRHIRIEFPERVAGGRTLPAQSADLAIKLNPAGLLPAIVMGHFGLLVILFAGRPLAAIASGAFLALVMLAYVAFLCDPDRMAERLSRLGGALPGIAPGEATAAALDRIISRLALAGAVYLVLALLLPRLELAILGLPLYLDGTALLLVVCIAIDLEAQVRAYLPVADVPQADAPAADVPTG